ncbi:hypothetical protein [Mycoplasma leonicaptivi]|uniref:hypothetical protein n=1 Tax=Mycoplasma leonicaptivi TaxID=36742 RepID=UPI00047F0BEE|nr:hypothetical protein [Mycoplasma leonicaptivi]
MNNDFLLTLKESYIRYKKYGSRSNEKLKILHGKIAKDISKFLNNKIYKIYSLGLFNGKEKVVKGSYNPKKIDIAITKNNQIKCCIGVKFIMSNYSQNSNNYFENMLDETVNIRESKIPYFQIIILPDNVPYYDKNGKILKRENISQNHIQKYINLSHKNINNLLHIPNKTLIMLISFDDESNIKIRNNTPKVDCFEYEDLVFSLSKTEFVFGDSVIYNDYEQFINTVVKEILK